MTQLTPTEQRALMAMMNLVLASTSQENNKQCQFCREMHYGGCRKDCVHKVADDAYHTLKREYEPDED